MEQDKRNRLIKEIENAETLLMKAKQKTALAMTAFYIIICGIALYWQKCSIMDVIIGAVIIGCIITFLTIVIYSFFTSFYTNQNMLEKRIIILKFKLDMLDGKDPSNIFEDDE
jgi:apolipoprotein N-acyltransferase